MPRLGGEVGFIAPLEANLSFEGPILLKFSPSISASFFHFVVAGPRELDCIAFGGAVDGTGDAPEGELATRFAEQDIGWPHHVGEVGLVVGHLYDAPFALNAHGGSSRSLGNRIRS